MMSIVVSIACIVLFDVVVCLFVYHNVGVFITMSVCLCHDVELHAVCTYLHTDVCVCEFIEREVYFTVQGA